jgi:hypothetical protein
VNRVRTPSSPVRERERGGKKERDRKKESEKEGEREMKNMVIELMGA